MIKFNSLSWTADSKVHVIHVIITYNLEPLSFLTQITHNPQVTINFRKMNKEKHKKVREIKFIGLFGDRGHRGPYKPCNHNLYIGIIIFPHIDNPRSTGYNQPKKKTVKIINAKSEGPINLTNHWRKRLWISLQVRAHIKVTYHWRQKL